MPWVVPLTVHSRINCTSIHSTPGGSTLPFAWFDPYKIVMFCISKHFFSSAKFTITHWVFYFIITEKNQHFSWMMWDSSFFKKFNNSKQVLIFSSKIITPKWLAFFYMRLIFLYFFPEVLGEFYPKGPVRLSVTFVGLCILCLYVLLDILWTKVISLIFHLEDSFSINKATFLNAHMICVKAAFRQ